MMRFVKIFGALITIAASIAAILSVYWSTIDKKPNINLKLISLESLTSQPRISELKAHYTFKDSTVNNLLVAYYLIQNNGNETIIGTGINKNVLVDTLSIRTSKKYFRFLKVDVRGKNFPIEATITKSNVITLSFLQWRPEEYFEVFIYLEGLKENSKDTTIVPSIFINEREILNASVEYSTLNSPNQEKKILATYLLPGFTYWIIYVLGIIIFSASLLILPYLVVNEIIDSYKFKSWNRKYGSSYDSWIEDQYRENRIPFKYSSSGLPSNFWKDFPGEKPKIPSFYNDTKTLILLVSIVFILTIIPILWMIRI